ncbi:hypothetical protein L0152_31290, partial [bacterium]|nr:hypothetical protein [bacterium]
KVRESSDPFGDCEVVFIDSRNRAINRDVRWVNGNWEFVEIDDLGGYADNNDRLREFVALLRTEK